MDDVVELVGEENVVQVVTDNVANFKAIVELLMEKKGICIGPHVLHTALI